MPIETPPGAPGNRPTVRRWPAARLFSPGSDEYSVRPSRTSSSKNVDAVPLALYGSFLPLQRKPLIQILTFHQPLNGIKIAELTPIANASVNTATAVNPGALRSCRSANRKSFMFVKLCCRPYSGCEPILHDLAVKQMHGALGVPGESFVVRHHADRGAAAMQLAKQLHHRFAVRRVEVTGRLVGEQDRRIARQARGRRRRAAADRRRAARDSASCGAPCRRARAPRVTRFLRSAAAMPR